MDTSKYPQFLIQEITPNTNQNKLLGSFSTLNDVGNGFAYLLILPARMIKGKISELDIEHNSAVFIPLNSEDIDLFQIGRQYTYFDGYWGERVEIVLNEARHWERILFQPSDAERIHYDENHNEIIEIVKDGWDHEHCAIDSQNISLEVNSYSYQDQFGIWVCNDCYEKYILQKSLDFIFYSS